MVATLVDVWRRHEYLYRAVLEASRTSGVLREMWDGYRESFVAPVAAMIDEERAAGRAPAGPDAETLAALLLELSDRTLERLDVADPAGIERRAEALTTIWTAVDLRRRGRARPRSAAAGPDGRRHTSGL